MCTVMEYVHGVFINLSIILALFGDKMSENNRNIEQNCLISNISLNHLHTSDFLPLNGT